LVIVEWEGDGAIGELRFEPQADAYSVDQATQPTYHAWMTHRIHVDTDFAGDPDDACALAMLLGDESADITGVTTTLEDGGHRHDCVRALLEMAGRTDIPSAAGFGRTLTNRAFTCTWDDRVHWPSPPPQAPTPPGAALDLLSEAIESEATILAIGGFTNLACLELARPGSLRDARIVAMAGWVEDPPATFPQWGAEMDFNTQSDTTSALIVAEAAERFTLVTMPVAMQATLKGMHLERLRDAGPVGELLAQQSEANRDTSGFDSLGLQFDGLPDDLVNFHWDPVAAGVALEWDCVTLRSSQIQAFGNDGVVEFSESGNGAGAITVSIDAAAFEERWLRSVEALHSPQR